MKRIRSERARIYPQMKGMVAGVMGLAVLAGAEVAAAETMRAGPVRYEVTKSEIFAGGSTGVSLNCPGSSRYTAAGMSIGGSNNHISELGGTDNATDGDADPDNGFAARAMNLSGSEQPVKSVGVCLKSGLLEYRVQNVFVGGGSSIFSGDTCDSGRMVGGGLAHAQAPNAVRLGAAAPWDADNDGRYRDGWVGRIVNGTGSGFNVAVQAVCASGLNIKHFSKGKVLRQQSAGTVTVRCPGGRHVVSGGFEGKDLVARTSIPIDSRDRGKAPDDGWRVKARNVSGDASAVVAHVLCLKK